MEDQNATISFISVTCNEQQKDETKKMEIGTSAQEVEKLYPELVLTDEKGKKSVAYNKLSMVALKAVDELHKEMKN